MVVYRDIFLSEICLFYIVYNTTYFLPNFLQSENFYICADLSSFFLKYQNYISKKPGTLLLICQNLSSVYQWLLWCLKLGEELEISFGTYNGVISVFF
jgi:hypothetical protein